jgi:hypothetical protein
MPFWPRPARSRAFGQCKFWSGVKGFLATSEQLFGCTAWRDTKLAVVMFLRERALTDIIEKARDALADHERFVEWRDDANETELHGVMSWPGDSAGMPTPTSSSCRCRRINPRARR